MLRPSATQYDGSANCWKYAEVHIRMSLDVLSVNVHTRRRGGGGDAQKKMGRRKNKVMQPTPQVLRGAVNKRTVRERPTAVVHAYPRSSCGVVVMPYLHFPLSPHQNCHLASDSVNSSHYYRQNEYTYK